MRKSDLPCYNCLCVPMCKTKPLLKLLSCELIWDFLILDSQKHFHYHHRSDYVTLSDEVMTKVMTKWMEGWYNTPEFSEKLFYLNKILGRGFQLVELHGELILTDMGTNDFHHHGMRISEETLMNEYEDVTSKFYGASIVEWQDTIKDGMKIVAFGRRKFGIRMKDL